MLKPSDESQPLSWDEERDRIIGLGEHSQRKNYYPELRSNLSRLERFRTLLDLSGETILLVTLPEGRVVDANAAACELFDCPPETLIGKLLPDLGLAETTDVLALLNADAGAVTPVLHHREISLRKAETILPLDLSHRAALVDGTWFGVLLAHDARSRHAAEAQLRLAARVISDSSEGIIITDAESRIIDVNTTFEEITGYTLDEVRGKNPRLLSSGRQDKAFYQKMWQSINDTGAWRGELWNRRKNGEVFPEWLSLSAIRDEYGKVSHYVCVFTDVTEAKAREARIQHMAHHDFLTGLPNRILLIDRFRQAEAAAQRNDGRYALLFIDLDRFKNVNDTLGHTIGDQLLCDVASRLVGTVRATDTISRQGGDEFIILLSDIDSPETVAHVARKVMAALSEPFRLGGHQITVTPSIGISVSPEDGDDLDSLLKHADLAMYDAKQQGRNNYQFFRREMNARSLEMLLMESDLRLALKKGEFVLHYQPQRDVTTGQIAGVEALLRWQHPERGLVSPADFIPMAEDTGLIVPIGQWVLETACRQLVQWRATGWSHLRMAVNLSAVQFRQTNLVEQVRHLLDAEQLPADALELEVTESILMSDAERTALILNEFGAMGVTLAIDDFGTGYSSLAYLKRFSVDVLKVDRSFVHNIGSNKGDAAICSAIIGLAHNLHLMVVAEGVETQAQYDWLAANGCHIIQGYFTGRPAPADRCLPALN
ncbi:MAG: EAL domain-containing protein [Zoogloeaceae bacterium]|nr:EAL domain-containing protein [Zoogloeaceae bacterium]